MSGKVCSLKLWHSLDFSLTFFETFHLRCTMIEMALFDKVWLLNVVIVMSLLEKVCLLNIMIQMVLFEEKFGL